nr:MAG TPA: hypothetical protein [Bacteriophage sp.]
MLSFLHTLILTFLAVLLKRMKFDERTVKLFLDIFLPKISIYSVLKSINFAVSLISSPKNSLTYLQNSLTAAFRSF